MIDFMRQGVYCIKFTAIMGLALSQGYILLTEGTAQANIRSTKNETV
jgi:hypothetical protein